VETAGDPHALRLLRAQRSAAALLSFGFEPFEHLVVRPDERGDLDWATLHQAVPGGQQVDGAHPLDEALDRGERVAEQEEVGGQHHDECHHEVDELDECDRGVDRDGRQREQQRRHDEQRRVDREDPPEQR
jgi:hypothetical protein